MGQDTGWKEFFSDNRRYADVINAIGCKGRQIVQKEDLQELDTQVAVKIRDMVRKVAFGVSFAVIGIENQEKIDYAIPLRTMVYDTGTYEKQASRIRKEVRRKKKGTTEYNGRLPDQSGRDQKAGEHRCIPDGRKGSF